MAPFRPSPPTIRGEPRSAPMSRANSWRAKPTTPRRNAAAGLCPASTRPIGSPWAVTPSIAAKVEAFPGLNVRETGVLPTKNITEPKPGVYVFDLGQNFAGFARLKANGPAGTKITLRFAEVLNPDGTIYTPNLREARVIDTYVLRGTGEEVWQPRFTFHGFRYVEVQGYPGKPEKDAIMGIAINSNIPLTGSFECSSPMINQLYKNIGLGRNGRTISPCRPTAPNATSGWDGWATPRRLSGPAPTTPTAPRSIRSGWSMWTTPRSPTASSPTWLLASSIPPAASRPGAMPASSVRGRSTRSTTTSGFWRSTTPP